MTTSYAKLFFWMVFSAVLLTYTVRYYDKNQGNSASIQYCEQSTGGYVDPRSGDGPECEQYAYKTVNENKYRTALRGTGEGLIPALILGFVGLYVGSVVDERKVKLKVRSKKAEPSMVPGKNETKDELLEDAIEVIKRKNIASTAILQRELKIGYSRAASLIEALEDMGLVGPADGARPREVYIKR